MSNFIKIRPVGAELFHADGQTDRHDESNSHISKNLCTRLKEYSVQPARHLLMMESEENGWPYNIFVINPPFSKRII